MKAVGLFVGRCDDVVERAGSDAIGKIDTTTYHREYGEESKLHHQDQIDANFAKPGLAAKPGLIRNRNSFIHPIMLFVWLVSL
uniref:Uncharacterized protein n=1 Tax=Hyaloperonospora arabidopsidis (strain Emoy2) TaxID=559515 RepID=M4C3N3_HYAAE